MSIKLWHCKDARSLRALWALEEMGLDYDLECLPFPPRYLAPEYLKINPLGTVPFLVDGQTTMTESTAICHYLVEKYQMYDFGLRPAHPEYGEYLNWLYHSDATLTFPQTIYLRYEVFASEDKKQPKVADDYRKWFLARLVRLRTHLKTREYLVAERFTIADIAIGYALFLGKSLGFGGEYAPELLSYLERLTDRPAFKSARSKGSQVT